MRDVLIKIIKKYKFYAFIQISLIILNIYLLTIPPKIIGYIVDLLYDIEKNKIQIVHNTYYLIGVCILILIVRTIWKFYDTYIPRSVEKELKNKLFAQIMKIKLGKIQNIKNGEIMSYFVKDANEIRAITQRLLSYGTRIVATAFIATYTMAKGVNLKLTIATMCPIVVTAYLIIVIKKYVEKNFKRSQKYFTEMSEYVQESTDSIRTTKAYSCEGEQLKEFIRKNKRVRESNNAVDVHSTLLSTCVNLCFGLCYGISIFYGSKLVLENQITIGDFVAFNGYIGLFVGPVSWIPNVISRFKRAQISYERLDIVFNLEKEKISTRSKDKEHDIKGDIQIKDLTFHYQGYLESALENINIDLKAGETLGIIGTIGSGKTTLMNLLLRLYPVEKGKIFIDGKDINDIPIDTLRKNICYITQDNFLFSTTLKNNISLFKDEYEDDEIEDSTRKAMIYDEIMEMSDGIRTVIGERGTDLSGGQRQRVVISRAFLNKSNIVIFDDTFSALDNRTEQKLLENIKELTKGKTCFIISNRISDVKISDKIIVLENGRIVEYGNHESLLEKQGAYYKYYQQQATKTEDSILN